MFGPFVSREFELSPNLNVVSSVVDEEGPAKSSLVVVMVLQKLIQRNCFEELHFEGSQHWHFVEKTTSHHRSVLTQTLVKVSSLEIQSRPFLNVLRIDIHQILVAVIGCVHYFQTLSSQNGVVAVNHHHNIIICAYFRNPEHHIGQVPDVLQIPDQFDSVFVLEVLTFNEVVDLLRSVVRRSVVNEGHSIVGVVNSIQELEVLFELVSGGQVVGRTVETHSYFFEISRNVELGVGSQVLRFISDSVVRVFGQFDSQLQINIGHVFNLLHIVETFHVRNCFVHSFQMLQLQLTWVLIFLSRSLLELVDFVSQVLEQRLLQSGEVHDILLQQPIEIRSCQFIHILIRVSQISQCHCALIRQIYWSKFMRNVNEVFSFST